MGQPTATLMRLVASVSSLMGRRLTQEEELQAYENIGSFFFLDDMLSAHSVGRVEGTYVIPPNNLVKVAPREDRTTCLNPTQFERLRPDARPRPQAGVVATCNDAVAKGHYGAPVVLAEGAGETGMGSQLLRLLSAQMELAHALEGDGRAMRLLRRLVGADPALATETTVALMWPKPGQVGCSDGGGSGGALPGAALLSTPYSRAGRWTARATS